MLRKKRDRTEPESEQPEDEVVAEELVDEAEDDPGEVYDRSAGPFDLSEVDEPDAEAAERLDLGCVQVPLLDGLEVRVEVDPDTERPAAITFVRSEGAVQIQVFAARKSGGGWDEARSDISRSLTNDGGLVDEKEGRFGTELYGTAYFTDEDGDQIEQRMRFVGVDGPRWMIRGVLLGAGAVPEDAAPLEEVFCSLVIVRGDAAVPPGTPLEITLPEQVPDAAEMVDEDDDED